MSTSALIGSWSNSIPGHATGAGAALGDPSSTGGAATATVVDSPGSVARGLMIRTAVLPSLIGCTQQVQPLVVWPRKATP
jgi:hypothetical protein